MSLLMLAGCGQNNNENAAPQEGEEMNQSLVSLSTSVISISEEKTYQLTATIDESLNRYLVFWSTRDEEIATVSDSGLVTALKVGTTICEVQCGKYFARCSITVTNYMPEDNLFVSFEKYEYNLNVDDEYVINPIVKLGDKTIADYSLTMEVGDSSILSTNNKTIKALKVGESDVLLTFTYQDYTAQSLIYVKVY